jgi:branched-chain amino acid transport system ATP-binding protein
MKRDPQALLTATGLRKILGGGTILKNLDLALEPGTVTLLTGTNGSGKTTLINCLSGFDRGYRGQIWFRSRRIDRHAAEDRARAGLVRTFQYPHIFPELSLADHLRIARGADGPPLLTYLQPPAGDVDGLLGEFDLQALRDRAGHQLSFGEMKLLNTARAFATSAVVLLLDEPLASLNVRRRECVVAAIARRAAAGCALLVVEHEAGELAKVVTRHLAISEGALTPVTR